MLGFASPLAVEKELRLETSAVRHVTGSLIRGEGLRFAIVSSLSFRFKVFTFTRICWVLLIDLFLIVKVVARFNEVVTKLLLEGAIETFKKYSVREEDIEVSNHNDKRWELCILVKPKLVKVFFQSGYMGSWKLWDWCCCAKAWEVRKVSCRFMYRCCGMIVCA